jgi:hypothetical protein
MNGTAPGGDEGIVSMKDGPAATSGVLPEEKVPKTRQDDPRPHPIALNEAFAERLSPLSRRHKVKPGITGWAQVNGFRGETDTIEKMRRRIECDLLMTLFSKRAYTNDRSNFPDEVDLSTTQLRNADCKYSCRTGSKFL